MAERIDKYLYLLSSFHNCTPCHGKSGEPVADCNHKSEELRMGNLTVVFGPTGWRFERYKEECRLGATSNTTYVTVGVLHIFYSRKE